MLDFPLVKLPVVDRIRPQSNTFATDVDVENIATGDSNLITAYQILN